MLRTRIRRGQPKMRCVQGGSHGGESSLPTSDRQRSRAKRRRVDLIEIAGAIKWFDVAKGYGFIVPDNGRPDVLLHVTCLRRDGYQTAYEGARVVVEALEPSEGPAGVPRLSMDESTAIHPPQMTPPRTHVTVDADERARAASRSSGSTASAATAS